MPTQAQREWLGTLNREQKAALLYEWRWWRRDKQAPPPGDWYISLVQSCRGCGKTRVGAEMIAAWAKAMPGARFALVAETAADARDVLGEGESGILAISPPTFRPKYEPSKRRLT